MNWRVRRLGQLALAAGIVAGLGVTTAGSAAATGLGQQVCNVDPGRSNTCFELDQMGAGQVRVHIGLDVTMDQASAQQILNTPSLVLNARLFTHTSLPGAFCVVGIRPTQEWVWAGGLSAEFDVFVDSFLLQVPGGAGKSYVTIDLPTILGTTLTFQSKEIDVSF